MFNLDNDLAYTGSVLDALNMRTQVAMNNIANQNTPGYKRYQVTFEEELRSAHASGDGVNSVVPKVIRDTSGLPGENNVSVFEEQSMLEKVRMLHAIFSQRAGGYFGKMNRAIRGQ